MFEVRDSRTGYLIPARYGLGVWADGKIVGTPPPPSASFGNSGCHSGQETMFGGFPMVLDSWWEISENGDRGFAQNFDARLMSIVVWPGEPFLNIFLKVTQNEEIHTFGKEITLIPRSPCSFFQDQVPKMCSFANVAPSQEHWGPIIGILLTDWRHWGPAYCTIDPQNGLRSNFKEFYWLIGGIEVQF